MIGGENVYGEELDHIKTSAFICRRPFVDDRPVQRMPLMLLDLPAHSLNQAVLQTGEPQQVHLGFVVGRIYPVVLLVASHPSRRSVLESPCCPKSYAPSRQNYITHIHKSPITLYAVSRCFRH